MIGIRQADGSFYEIMGDAQPGHKRLVLSAARTDQHGVRIDLYRSLEGTASDEGALGSITLDDPQGLGYQDIEFQVDLDAEGQLTASARLPGQEPRTLSVDLTPFRAAGSESLVPDEFPPMDLDLDAGSETMTLDLPEAEDLPEEAPRRSDADILGDESFASADLDTLDDFSLDAEEGTPETRGLDDLGAPSEFDLGDLDAGFGEDPVPESSNPAEEWEKISLDDMEPMEFLDTGAEISAPSKGPGKTTVDEVEEPLELGDFDADLSDLPDLGDFDTPSQSPSMDLGNDNDLDQDFLAPPELTEPSPWESDDQEVVEEKIPAAVSAPKASAGTIGPRAASATGAIDKMSLFLSLASLSLLVLLILVLLFLNMIKSPQPPVIQPEVQRWKTPEALASAPDPLPGDLDLGAADPVVFEAETVLEVPRALRDARISLVLEPGESVEDVQRRFGAPAKAQGNLLSW